MLIHNGRGALLLQLRDDKPGILFPNCWSTFGGHMQDAESPIESIRREAVEELGYLLEEPVYIGNIPYLGHDCFVYVKEDPTIDVNSLRIGEGQKAAFFSQEEAKKITNWAFNTKEIVEVCFRRIKNI